jgi:hypothetical protein
MSINVGNSSRKDNTLTTPIIRQQRSSCAIKIHRYDNEDLIRLININALNDKSLASGFNADASKNLKSKNEMIIRQDIVRCAVTNNKAGNGGNFSVSIKRGKQISGGVNTQENVDYLRAIQPGDWITIYMKKSGEITDADLNSNDPKSGLKFLGIIENVRYVEVDDPTKGSPRLEIVITGRSFSKVFDTNIFFNPIVNQQAIQAILGVDFNKDSSKSSKPLLGNTADSVMKRIINFYLRGSGSSRSTANENWYIPLSVARLFKGSEKNKPLGKAFTDILNTSRIGLQKYNKGVLRSVSILPGVSLIKALPSSGTIWSVMQFMQNSAVNELYSDLILVNGKLQPGIVLRQLPFSNKKNHETSVYAAHLKYNKKVATDPVADSSKTFFVDLPKLSIVSSDIKQKNVGKSDHERINYVIVVPKIDNETLDILYVVGANPASVQRYGLKIFQSQTSYVLSAGVSNKEGIKNFCARSVGLIQDWFFLSHNLYNGTIIVDGVDDFVEVGSNLYISDIKQLFHIEGYTHTYQIEADGRPVYESEFRVSRGQYFDESSNLAAFIGSNSKVKEATTVVTSYVTRSKEG